MDRKNIPAMLSMIVALLFPGLIHAVPNRVPVQGFLFDRNGNPYTSTRQVEFRLYQGGGVETPDGGTVVYKERADVTPDASGIFEHLLGSGTPLEGHTLTISDFDTAQDVYIQINIDSFVLLPRIKMGSLPYAFVAGQAQTVSDGAVGTSTIVDGSVTRTKLNSASFNAAGPGLVPPGFALLSFSATTCPSGYTRFTLADGRYIAGADIGGTEANVPNGTGQTMGQWAHNHDIAHTHGGVTDVTGNIGQFSSAGPTPTIGFNHSHAFTTSSQSTSTSGSTTIILPGITATFCVKD